MYCSMCGKKNDLIFFNSFRGRVCFACFRKLAEAGEIPEPPPMKWEEIRKKAAWILDSLISGDGDKARKWLSEDPRAREVVTQIRAFPEARWIYETFR